MRKELLVVALVATAVGVVDALSSNGAHTTDAALDLGFEAAFDETVQRPYLLWLQRPHRMSEQAVRRAMRGKKLVMMGDSLTRYQYLNLVYLLEHGKWPEPDSGMCNESKLQPWPNFYRMTNDALRGREICDCARRGCCEKFAVFENRRYHNSELGTTVWYVQWFGDKSFPHGHVRIMDPQPDNEDDDKLPCMPWDCASIQDAWTLRPAKFLEQFVTNHQPDAFVFNSGHHTLYDFGSANQSSVAEELYKTLRRMRRHQSDLPTRVVWKTTTPMHNNGTLAFKRDGFAVQLKDEGLVEFFSTAVVVKALFDEFIKRSQTIGLFMWDRLHYNCWVHQELNTAMVRQLFARRPRWRQPNNMTGSSVLNAKFSESACEDI